MNSLKGHLLIATPQLASPVFSQTVIVMLDHSKDGAMGVILNRPMEATVSEISGQVFEEAIDWDKPLRFGGPVPGPLMVIHTDELLSDQEVIAGIYSTIEASKIKDLIRGRAEPSLIVANYAGWGPGQLESEFDVDSWLTLPATAEHIFWTGDKDLWKVVVGAINARKLSEFFNIRELPPDPTLN